MQAEVTNASHSLIRPLVVGQNRKDQSNGSLSSFKWLCNPFPYCRWISRCPRIYLWINEPCAWPQAKAEWRDEWVWPLFFLWIVVRSSKVRITDLEQAQIPINDLNKDIIDKRRWELNPLIIFPFVLVLCSSSFLTFVQNRGLMWWVNMVQIYNQEEIKLSQSPWQENVKGDFHFTRPNALSPFIDLLECSQQAQPALDRLIMGDLYPSLFIYSTAGQFHLTTCGYPWEKKRNVFCPPQVTFPFWKSIPPRKPFSQKAAIQHGCKVPPGRMKYLEKPSLWTE